MLKIKSFIEFDVQESYYLNKKQNDQNVPLPILNKKEGFNDFL